MNGCELIKCNFYINGRCTDEAEYVNKYTGEPMCRHNPDAIPVEGNFEAILCDFEDLPDNQKDKQPNNGPGKEYASYLIIKHKGEIIRIQSDAMEPEDANFLRDLWWIKDALIQAYELGRGSK
ncbi:MAG TPA: hypothetical protein DCR95_04605 [Desulfobacter sp.]|nr:hypothetical protein [Desulfobacter sp.]